jgi:hypothetical protein
VSNLVTISVLGIHLHAWFAILALGCTLLVLDTVSGLCCNEARGRREASGSHISYLASGRTDETAPYGSEAWRSRSGPRESERHLSTSEKSSQRNSASRRGRS